MIDAAAARDLFEASTDGTVGIEEEFALLDPRDHRLVPAFERLRDAGTADEVLAGDASREDLVGLGRGAQLLESLHERARLRVEDAELLLDADGEVGGGLEDLPGALHVQHREPA